MKMLLPSLMLGLIAIAIPCASQASNQLPVNGRLDSNQSLTSAAGRITLTMQADCNLVASQGPAHKAYWSTETNGKGTGCFLSMQSDGNLVVYSGTKALWASNTNGKPSSGLTVQDDGNLVMERNGAVVWKSGSEAGDPWAGCAMQAGSNPAVKICYIYEPNVKSPQTEYPMVTFNPADTIRVDAQGCVQTGGHGKTWKDYVNPRGDNAPRLYQGQIKIPGVIPSLAAISSFNGKTIEFPSNVDPHLAFLTLGYTDDDYSDNGYYSHDDGNDDQCKDKGPASVTLTITTQGQTFTISPKFQVLTVIYAPPGCTSTSTVKCDGVSSVDYGQGSSAGTKVSTGDSFKAGVNVSLSLGLSGVDSISGSGGFSVTASDTTSQTVSKTSSYDIKATGNQDGTNHDQDRIVVLLNPAVAVRASNSSAQWFSGYTPPTAFIQQLPVAWIKHRPALPCNSAAATPDDQMPCTLATQLQQHGFNQADYNNILAQDPFAANPDAPVTARFVPTSYGFPYDPLDQSTSCNGGVCTCAPLTVSMKDEIDQDTAIQQQTEVTAGLESSAGILIATLKVTDSFTWTNTSTDDYTKGANQSATASIACASPSYTGKVFMQIYWDTIYNSFLFVPVDLPGGGMSEGLVTNKDGKAAINQAVSLTLANGKTFHTFTDRTGHYRFPTPKSHAATGTAAQLEIGALRTSVPLGTQAVQRLTLQ